MLSAKREKREIKHQLAAATPIPIYT